MTTNSKLQKVITNFRLQKVITNFRLHKVTIDSRPHNKNLLVSSRRVPLSECPSPRRAPEPAGLLRSRPTALPQGRGRRGRLPPARGLPLRQALHGISQQPESIPDALERLGEVEGLGGRQGVDLRCRCSDRRSRCHGRCAGRRLWAMVRGSWRRVVEVVVWRRRFDRGRAISLSREFCYLDGRLFFLDGRLGSAGWKDVGLMHGTTVLVLDLGLSGWNLIGRRVIQNNHLGFIIIWCHQYQSIHPSNDASPFSCRYIPTTHSNIRHLPIGHLMNTLPGFELPGPATSIRLQYLQSHSGFSREMPPMSFRQMKRSGFVHPSCMHL